MSVVGYYYLHENGDLIFKYERPEVERGGFVKHVWEVDPQDRGGAYTILLEAIALGAKWPRIEELSKKWGMTDEDCLIGAAYFGMLLMKDGDRWAVRYADSNDRFGIVHRQTAFDAMCELVRRNYVRRGNRV